MNILFTHSTVILNELILKADKAEEVEKTEKVEKTKKGNK